METIDKTKEYQEFLVTTKCYKKSQDWYSPRNFKVRTALPRTLYWISSLQNYERINAFLLFKATKIVVCCYGRHRILTQISVKSVKCCCNKYSNILK